MGHVSDRREAGWMATERLWNISALFMSVFVLCVLIVIMLPSASGILQLGLLLMGGAILLCCILVLLMKLLLEAD
jgi:flagellar biosynthesis component FlhA